MTFRLGPAVVMALFAVAEMAAGDAPACVVDDFSVCTKCSPDGSACVECGGLPPAVLVDGACVQCNVTTIGEWDQSCSVCKPEDPTFCLQCKDYCNSRGCTGYFVTTDGECSKCPEGAAHCEDFTGEVTACRNGYGLVGGECRPCEDDACKHCDGNLSFCRDCWVDRYEGADGVYPDLATGLCKPCDKGCHTCIGPGQCSECAGLPLDPVSGTCLPCSVANCARCPAAVDRCEQCADGYRLDEAASSCVPCSVDGCAACDDGAEFCTGCLPGYGLVLGKCVRCNTADTGCASCDDNPALCTSCTNDTLSPHPDTGICSPCLAANCSMCAYDDATACEDFYCDPGFFFNETTRQCEACLLPGCGSCSNDPLGCDVFISSFGCLPHFWWDRAGGTCEPCSDVACEICDIYKGTACERCEPGFFLERGTKQCKQCTAGALPQYTTCLGFVAAPPAST